MCSVTIGIRWCGSRVYSCVCYCSSVGQWPFAIAGLGSRNESTSDMVRCHRPAQWLSPNVVTRKSVPKVDMRPHALYRSNKKRNAASRTSSCKRNMGREACVFLLDKTSRAKGIINKNTGGKCHARTYETNEVCDDK